MINQIQWQWRQRPGQWLQRAQSVQGSTLVGQAEPAATRCTADAWCYRDPDSTETQASKGYGQFMEVEFRLSAIVFVDIRWVDIFYFLSTSVVEGPVEDSESGGLRSGRQRGWEFYTLVLDVWASNLERQQHFSGAALGSIVFLLTFGH